jgi:hypothetical protein
MAETQEVASSDEFETRLTALEKSIRELRQTITRNNGKLTEAAADAATSRENSVKVVTMLEEVLPLVRKAAPLLDSPMAKLAQSPAAGVMGLFTGGRRG